MSRVTLRMPKNWGDLFMKSFPNPAFNYGGNGIVTQQERKNRIDEMKKRWEEVERLPATNYTTPADKMSDLSKRTSRTADAIVRNATNSNEWFRRLINQHPPSPEFSLERILQEATDLCPGKTISHSTLWKRVIKHVNEAINEGYERKWADDCFDVPPLPDLESFEILRIYGDAKGGSGTWPSTMTARLAMAGAGWVQVPAENRIIPLYWKNYCDENKIRYKLAVPGNTSPSELKQKYMPSSLPFDRAATMTTAADSPTVMRPRPPSPSCDLGAKDPNAEDFEVRVLADPWKDTRAVNEDTKHHTSALRYTCEAIKPDASTLKLDVNLAAEQDRMVTKKDLEDLVKDGVEAFKDVQVSAKSSPNAGLPFLHGEEVALRADTGTISSISDFSDRLSQSIQSDGSNGFGQHQPQNIAQKPAPGPKMGPSSVFLSHCKNGTIAVSEAIMLYVFCDTPLGLWCSIS
ncbi:hypothetical protein SLS62_002248 [Diatrype stigma]|uniref:Uncharacterized protein n=1 Tax=Diatrype stigma TaxID=117547 RepID=A0AAN9UWQ3_9PEZI